MPRTSVFFCRRRRECVGPPHPKYEKRVAGVKYVLSRVAIHRVRPSTNQEGPPLYHSQP